MVDEKYSLSGKTAIITGASGGIGAAIAKELAKEGANVVLAARRAEKLDEIVQEINGNGDGKALAVATDVANEAEVRSLANRANDLFGSVDICQ